MRNRFIQNTKFMKFRNGGRVRNTDQFSLNGHPIDMVKTFKYLGLTLTPTARSFTAHIIDRSQKAITATFQIPNLRALSLSTALKLFRLKISPIAAYGIDLIWHHLTITQLQLLDRIKPAFLKRVLGVSKYARNRIVYLLCSTSTFIEDLKTSFHLDTTPVYEQFLHVQENKFTEIDPDIFVTPAFTTEAWTAPNRENRHVVTRFAAHGYHHLICYNNAFHTAEDGCVCRLCGERCRQYHLMSCSMNSQSLNFWANE
jgi:hypothetical protein